MKIFVFGSCRIWNACYNNNWSDKNSVIQSHYSDEIQQIINWIVEKKNLSKEEYDTFRGNVSPINWKKYIQNFQQSEVVLIEISSIKNAYLNGLYYNLLNTYDIPTQINANIHDKIINLHCQLKKLGKEVIFFTHANSYSKRNKGFITNRIHIQEEFKNAIKKHPAITFIDPSELISKYGQLRCLQPKIINDGTDGVHDEFDINHYTDFMHKLIAASIEMKTRH